MYGYSPIQGTWSRFLLKSVGKDRGFPCVGMAAPRDYPGKIPQSSPARPWKTPTIPPLLIGLNQSIQLLETLATIFFTVGCTAKCTGQFTVQHIA